MEKILETLQIDDWTVRIRRPDSPGPYPVFLLLHGWTGDENSMWIFASRLPDDALLIAPRGLHPAPMGGYSWVAARTDRWASLDAFRPALAALLDLVTPANFPDGDFARLRAAGFSQGAALTYSLALLHPDKLLAFGGLAGFMPDDVEEVVAARPLAVGPAGLPAFVTHGSQDNIVPLEKARRAVEQLEAAGAQVTFCVDDVGHKLSLNCFRGLETFFERH